MAKKTDVTDTSKKGAAKAAETKKKKKGGIRQYFRELRAELKKVVWPTRKQVLNNTGVVMTMMIIMALFLFGIDSGLGAAVQALLKIGS